MTGLSRSTTEVGVLTENWDSCSCISSIFSSLASNISLILSLSWESFEILPLISIMSCWRPEIILSYWEANVETLSAAVLAVAADVFFILSIASANCCSKTLVFSSIAFLLPSSMILIDWASTAAAARSALIALAASAFLLLSALPSLLPFGTVSSVTWLLSRSAPRVFSGIATDKSFLTASSCNFLILVSVAVYWGISLSDSDCIGFEACVAGAGVAVLFKVAWVFTVAGALPKGGKVILPWAKSLEPVSVVSRAISDTGGIVIVVLKRLLTLPRPNAPRLCL